MSDFTPTITATNEPPEGTALWVERVAPRVYVGRSQRGGQILIGPADSGIDGVFSPGELLKLALAGCAAMTADSRVSDVLGPDTPVTVAIDGTKHESVDRYEHFDEKFIVDTSSLYDDARAKFKERVERAISRGCTVGLTISNGAEIDLDFVQPE
jgi:uncharacterized OsmC-like protein